MSKVTATAKVTVEIEISNLGSWGEDCSIEQIHKQATEAAIGILKRNVTFPWKINGMPDVTAIITSRQ